jgi:hypothetical protein
MRLKLHCSTAFSAFRTTPTRRIGADRDASASAHNRPFDFGVQRNV